jgi:hypothetical protein
MENLIDLILDWTLKKPQFIRAALEVLISIRYLFYLSRLHSLKTLHKVPEGITFLLLLVVGILRFFEADYNMLNILYIFILLGLNRIYCERVKQDIKNYGTKS